MRDLTGEEMRLLDLTRDVYAYYLALPEVHPGDIEEFVIHLHAMQNIILARPATESIQEEVDDQEA